MDEGQHRITCGIGLEPSTSSHPPFPKAQVQTRSGHQDVAHIWDEWLYYIMITGPSKEIQAYYVEPLLHPTTPI